MEVKLGKVYSPLTTSLESAYWCTKGTCFVYLISVPEATKDDVVEVGQLTQHGECKCCLCSLKRNSRVLRVVHKVDDK